MSVYQASLLAGGEPRVDDTARFERVQLDDTAWVDVARGWLRGPDTLFHHLVDTVGRSRPASGPAGAASRKDTP